MTHRIILTLTQAMALQRYHGPDNHESKWPYDWSAALALDIPDEPDCKPCPLRMDVAELMLERGCTTEQVEEQMNWKSGANALQTVRLRMARKAERAARHAKKAEARAAKIKPAKAKPVVALDTFTDRAKAHGVEERRARYLYMTRDCTEAELWTALEEGTEEQLPLAREYRHTPD